MAFAHVVTTEVGGSSGGTTPGVDTSGATLLVAVITDAGFASVTISDSKSNTWTLLTRRTATNASMVIAYVENPTVGTGHTFTLGGGNIFSSLEVSAFSGALTASDPFDQENGATSTSATSLATGSLTPSETDCLVIAGIVCTNGTGVLSINGGFTIAGEMTTIGGQHNAVGLGYLIQTSAAAANPSWSWTDTSEAGVALAVFKSDGGAAPTREQEGFRFRNDDGSETTATWAQNQDTNHAEDVSTNVRLRILINATDDPASTQYRLDYKLSTDPTYVAVPLTATTGPATPTLGTDEATESGNNTATTSWDVSYPNAATGDLLIFCISWDDSTSTTDVAEPAGPNSEVLSEVNATPAVSSNTACRAKVWYTVATGAWSASTLAFTPTASEQWTAAVAVIPAGEFDATTPIGASTTHASAGVTETDVLSAAFSAGATDGDGRLLCWTAANQDPQTLAADWTQVANQDRGIVSGGLFSRDAEVTDSESIAEDTVSTIAGDDWCSVSFIVRAPAAVSNPIHLSASANIGASGEATTALLTAPSGKSTSDFVAGRIQDDENPADAVDITTDDYTELEWCLIAQSGVAAHNDVYQFRVTANGTDLDTYTVTPQWTIDTGGGGGSTAGPLLPLLGVG